MKTVAIALLLLVAAPCHSMMAPNDRGLWRRALDDTGVYVAQCAPIDSDGRVACDVLETFKGPPVTSLRVTLLPAVLPRAEAERGSRRVVLADRFDVLPEVRVGDLYDFLLVPEQSGVVLREYLATYARLAATSDPAARNVAYWRALEDWLANDDPFIREIVTRDLTGGRSLWGDRIPDAAMAVDLALASSDIVRRSRFWSIACQETRDNPSDHAQEQLVRLLEQDPDFARNFLSNYPLAPFRRDAIVLAALRRIERSPSGKDALVRERAARILRERAP